MAMKLDMNKAFDRVSWHFLLYLLQRHGFFLKWQQLIMGAVTIVSYRILINGEPTDKFIPKCGIRQGDPISPYLFIICMNCLSLMLDKAQINKEIQGIKLSRYNIPITHLLYADDSLLCFKATPSSCIVVKQIIADFEEVSGQMVNYAKSYLKYSPNAPPDFKQYLSKLLTIQYKDNFGVYLGVLADIGRNKVAPFGYLLDKVIYKLTSWNTLNLSQSAKLVLINAVLIASLNHVMLIFKLPQGVTAKIEATILAFWWASSGKKRSIHWLSNKVLHLPKQSDGLQLRNIQVMNQALLAKNYNRIMNNPQLLLSKVFKAKYSKDCGVIPPLKRNHYRPSWGLKSILKAAHKLQDGFAWKLGNGAKINLISDPWINGSKPIISNQVPQEASLSVHALVNNDGSWNMATLRQHFHDSSIQQIINMEPPNVNIDDFIYWKYTSDGRYTVSSAYKTLISDQVEINANVPMQFWRHLWKLKLHPCCKLFIWKLMHNALPTKDLLTKKVLPLPPFCILCKRFPETADHLFRHCEITQRIWRSGELGLRSSMNRHITLQQWISDFVSYFLKNDCEGGQFCITVFCSTLWAIWLARNDMEFREKDATPLQVLIRSKELTRQQLLLFNIKRKHTQTSDSGPRINSTNNKGGRIQVAATRGKQHGISGLAWLSEDTGMTHGKTVISSSPIHALSMSLLMAMQWAVECNILEATFLIPSKQIVEALTHGINIPVHFCNTIDKIMTYNYRFNKCDFHLCANSDVSIAYKLATTYSM
ncbi:uncharacterized protein LOC141608108 [Silene latifolia]|uniref:uncharacterized protein LOC141608108 n=1 Tax=Silene latifolia TaxID=37657 RepID=UPI003D788BA1